MSIKVTGILNPFGEPIIDATLVVTSVMTDGTLKGVYLETQTSDTGKYEFQLIEGMYHIEYQQDKVRVACGVVVVNADTPKELDLIKLFELSQVIPVPETVVPTDWEVALMSHISMAQKHTHSNQATHREAGAQDTEEASSTANSSLARNIDTAQSKHGIVQSEQMAFTKDGNSLVQSSETLSTSQITVSEEKSVSQDTKEIVKLERSVKTSNHEVNQCTKVDENVAVESSVASVGAVTKTKQTPTTVESIVDVESDYFIADGSNKTEVLDQKVISEAVHSLTTNTQALSAEQVVTLNSLDGSVISLLERLITEVRQASREFTVSDEISLVKYIVNRFQVGDTFRVDDFNRKVIVDGELVINNVEDFKGDTIFQVYQYARTAVGDWHDEFEEGDEWRRHNWSVNTVIDPEGWSKAYHIVGEDGQAGDTLYMEYNYSMDKVNWVSSMRDGDIWRRERMVTNGVPAKWSEPSRIVGADGLNGVTQYIEYEYSIDGLTIWHSNFSTGDHYRRERLVTDGVEGVWSPAAKIVPVQGEDYDNGYNSMALILYKRAKTIPEKPTKDITYTFSNQTLSGDLGGWSNYVPSGSDPVYVIGAVANSLTDTDVIPADEWSNPILLVESGESRYQEYEYSADGAKNWHTDLTDADYFRRERTVVVDSAGDILFGDWTNGVRIRKDGEDGYTPQKGVDYFDGVTRYTEFQFSANKTDWHFPERENDRYMRTRLVIDGTPQAWGGVTDLKGTDGNSYTLKGSDTLANIIAKEAVNGDLWVSTTNGQLHGATVEVGDGIYYQDGWTNVGKIVGQDGADGDTRYEEYEYSVTGTSLWHPDFMTGDKFRRQRIVINGQAGEWSNAARIAGFDGINGSDGIDGDTIEEQYRYNNRDNVVGATAWNQDPRDTDTYRQRRTLVNNVEDSVGTWHLWRVDGKDGADGENGADGNTIFEEYRYSNDQEGTNPTDWNVSPRSNDFYRQARRMLNGVQNSIGTWHRWRKDGLEGAFHSYIYQTATEQPSKPTGGGYNGNTETFPSGWLDNPYYTDGETTWVSHTVYKPQEDGTWLNTGWSIPSQYVVKGDAGDDATERYTWIKYADSVTGEGLSDNSEGKLYIGIAYNQLTETESTEPSDYSWSRIQGSDGAFISYIYRLSADTPADPVGGSYNGTTEVVPTDWSDNPVYSSTLKTWVSTVRYVQDGKTWSKSADWSTPVQWLGSDGADGSDGMNSAVINLYARGTSAPAMPTSVVTYTFATGVSTAVTGWSRLIPSGNTPLWVISALAISAEATDTIATSEWSDPVIMSQNGEDGQDGNDGINGADGHHGAGSYIWYKGTKTATQAELENFYRVYTGLEPAPKGTIVQVCNGATAEATTDSTYYIKQGTEVANWESFTFRVNGSAIIDGTLAARALKANEITGDLIKADTKITIGSGSSQVNIDGTDYAYAFYVGSNYGSTSYFSIDDAGKMKATDADVRGTIRATQLIFEDEIPPEINNSNVEIPHYAPIPEESNMLDVSSWKEGKQGKVGMFNKVGKESENNLSARMSPFGSDIVWEAIPDGNSESDGGWQTDLFPISHQRSYRYAVWFQIKDISKGGSFYLGCKGNNVTEMSGVVNSNPYFVSFSISSSGLQSNKWYLAIGNIHPSTYTGSVGSSVGVFDPVTKEQVLNGRNFKHTADATEQVHRNFLYYTHNTEQRLRFARPRVEWHDEMVPLTELLDAVPVGTEVVNNAMDDAVGKSPMAGSLVTLDFSTKEYQNPISDSRYCRVVDDGNATGGQAFQFMRGWVGDIALSGNRNKVQVKGLIQGRKYIIKARLRRIGAQINTNIGMYNHTSKTYPMGGRNIAVSTYWATYVVERNFVPDWDANDYVQLYFGDNVSNPSYANSILIDWIQFIPVDVDDLGAETPTGSQNKADAALNGAKDYAANNLSAYGWGLSSLVTREGSKLRKHGGSNNWDGWFTCQAYFTGGCAASWRCPDVNPCIYMLGINDSQGNTTFTDINHAFYVNAGNAYIYENGSNVLSCGAVSDYAQFEINYDGQYVKYYINGSLKRTVSVGANKRYCLDGSIHTITSHWVVDNLSWSSVAGSGDKALNAQNTANAAGNTADAANDKADSMSDKWFEGTGKIDVKSAGYSYSGRTGWAIFANGNADLFNVRIRGHVEATSGTFENVVIKRTATIEEVKAEAIVGDIVSAKSKTITPRTSTAQLGQNTWYDILSVTVKNSRSYNRTLVIQSLDDEYLAAQMNVIASSTATEIIEYEFRLVDGSGSQVWHGGRVRLEVSGSGGSRWANAVTYMPVCTVSANKKGTYKLQFRCTNRKLSQMRTCFDWKENEYETKGFMAQLFKDSGELS